MDTLNEKIEGLVKKAEKSGMPYSILKKVYDRGMAAWKTGHRPGTTPQQWAFARVNSFVTKSSGTWGKADADLAKQVRGEEVERRTTAKSMLGQVREKLDKDSDAGDYVKDFRKSDAPQFKGKSDKKKQKMAIAAYLDSKEEKDLDESLKFKYAVVDTSKNNEVIAMSSDEKDMQDTMRRRKERSLKVVKLKRPTKNDNMIGYPLKEEIEIQESGHTDVPSMKTQVQIAMDALQKMNTELGKLSDEEELPTWWTNKVATAVSKLDGMADYIDAKHDQGDKMNEDNITEEKVFVVRFEKEGMRFAVPFSDMKRAKDGEKILKKSAGVSNVSVTKDILKPGVSMSKFRTRQEGKIVKESKMGELFLDMQMDAQEMSERDFIKTYSKQGFQAAELKRMHKEFNEEVEIEESLFGAMYDKFVKAAKSMSKDKFVKTYTGKQVMPGQTKSMGKKDLEDIWVDFNEEVDNSLMAQATRVISQTSIKEKIDPADIDDIATADDRKAADKNIIIQLRRAQDMQGKADVTFKDKPSKKEKIDIRVINKALDMFDKMKPNDKAKMQTTIGKSYRDLLKTVQRGRV